MKKLKDKFNIEIDGTVHEVKKQMQDYYALFGETWVKLKINIKQGEDVMVKRASDNFFYGWLLDISADPFK